MGFFMRALRRAKALVDVPALVLENLALRQQLAILQRTSPRPRLRDADRLFWVALSTAWAGWRDALTIVRPETVLRWHRAGFRHFWLRLSRGGRPRADGELRALVRRLAADNPTWGAPRIHGELLKLSFQVAQSTVARYLPPPRTPKGPPSQAWKTFLHNHRHEAAAMDFFVIPTATFRLLYGFVVLEHDRRRIRHVAVTEHPTAEWTAQQLREAFAFEPGPRFLHRDRDGLYKPNVLATIRGLALEDVVSAPRSPWQNPYCERAIGTLRRELLDHVIILDAAHARRLLREYVGFYNRSRTHLALAKDAPEPRPIEGRHLGPVHVENVLGGLHHRYFRQAA